MINWKSYPVNIKITDGLLRTVKVFEICESDISSEKHTHSSDKVLSIIADKLKEANYDVEASKRKEDKISLWG